VGNYDRGAAFHQFFQGVLHQAFIFTIKRRSGFVQNQDARVFQYRPGNGMRCRCPPESWVPLSPTSVSGP
jgi:hypothetical protein